MDALTRFITNKKKLVVIFFAVIGAVCAVLLLGLSVNYNLTDYLPAEAQSTLALQKMEAEFDENVPNIRAMVEDVSLTEALEWKEQLASIEGVSSVMWLDDVINVKEPIEMADAATVEGYYQEDTALFSITAKAGYEVEVTNTLYELLEGKGAADGAAVTTASTQLMAANESLGAVAILVPLIIIILLVTSSSWIEPVLFLAAIGMSVLINMGTNVFLGEISNITLSISPILQMAVSLDYAIFLLHRFEEERSHTDDVDKAMRKAIKKSFPAVAGSAATTLFGFLALMFMDFRIGPDLGLNLAKGIILSYLSVMIFMPALTLLCYRWIDKTKHRKLLPDFPRIGKWILKIRVPAFILVLLLIIPCYLGQQRIGFIYGTGEPEADSRLGQDTEAINEVLGKSAVMVVLVPRGDTAKEKELGLELQKIQNVSSAISYAETVGVSIPEEYLDESILANFYSENYARIILYTDTEDEGEEAFALVEAVRKATAEYYESSYTCGQSANLYDMKEVVTRDNMVVNLVAVIAIALVLLIAFRSLSLPLLLVFVIESAIWINLSVPYFTGTSLSYIGYLVINTVQLGATIDYAILLNENYLHKRSKLNKKKAMEQTIKENFIPILTSALILALSGFTLAVTSSNSIVSEMGILLFRGTLLSFTLVLCVLPCILLVFDKVIEKTTLHISFYKEDLKHEKSK